MCHPSMRIWASLRDAEIPNRKSVSELHPQRGLFLLDYQSQEHAAACPTPSHVRRGKPSSFPLLIFAHPGKPELSCSSTLLGTTISQSPKICGWTTVEDKTDGHDQRGQCWGLSFLHLTFINFYIAAVLVTLCS